MDIKPQQPEEPVDLRKQQQQYKTADLTEDNFNHEKVVDLKRLYEKKLELERRRGSIVLKREMIRNDIRDQERNDKSIVEQHKLEAWRSGFSNTQEEKQPVAPQPIKQVAPERVASEPREEIVVLKSRGANLLGDRKVKPTKTVKPTKPPRDLSKLWRGIKFIFLLPFRTIRYLFLRIVFLFRPIAKLFNRSTWQSVGSKFNWQGVWQQKRAFAIFIIICLLIPSSIKALDYVSANLLDKKDKVYGEANIAYQYLTSASEW